MAQYKNHSNTPSNTQVSVFTKNKHVYLYLGVGLVALVVGLWIGTTITKTYQSTTAVREQDGQYKFISPLLFTDNLQPDTKDYKVLDSNLNSYINDVVSKGQANKVSVYFRDLNSGHWMGINENDQYTPASLLKIAILTAYLREVEINPSILEQSLQASPDSPNLDLVQNYKPKDPIQLGKPYTVRTLLSDMIVESDNNAMALLTQNISTSSIDIIYKDLQIPMNNGSVSDISPALYSRFFRILYNSSYLSHTASESVLGLLSQTDFTVGLVAGVPAGTTVSHKFGENVDSSGNEVQLHDCGIVYYPEHPYFVCVMTKGKDFGSLEKVISTISKTVWDDVDGQ
jgi:Beta-lactamase enzyme family